jgi:hypothetical protein
MAEPKSRGTPMGGPPDLGRAHSALQGSLGDANMQDRGLGHGQYADGKNVGSFDSVYAVKNLTAAGTFDIPHNLGRVPGWARVWEVEHGSDLGAQVQITSIAKASWTRATFRVRVQAIAGSLAGMKVTFELGG